MATRTSSQILRSLAKELSFVYGKKSLTEVPAYAYLRNQIKQFEVTGEKICRGQNEVQHTASTYLCYLESLRKQEEICAHYRGRGERTVESSAAIVGLKLPTLYTDEAPAKKPDH